MQHFVVPSSGLGSQSQIITIPVNLLSQGNSQPISLVTSNGQIIQFQNISNLASICKLKKKKI